LPGAVDGGSVAGDAIGAPEAALAAAIWTGGGGARNRCCGAKDCRGLERPGTLAFAIDGPRDGFGLAIDAEREGGCAERAIPLTGCDGFSTGCVRVSGAPGFEGAFATGDDNAFGSAIGEGCCPSGASRATFGAGAAMALGSSARAGMPSTEGDGAKSLRGGGGVAGAPDSAATRSGGAASNIERIASRASRARSARVYSGSPMNGGAASATRATMIGASTVALHTPRRVGGARTTTRTGVMAVGTTICVAMRTGSAARIDGTIRVIGVIGDAEVRVVTSRASSQP
jgi:hypothetical protein